LIDTPCCNRVNTYHLALVSDNLNEILVFF
jgi:hypothetical protein